MRGGSTGTINDQYHFSQTYKLATDSQRNVYGLSKVGRGTLDIAGNQKTYYGSSYDYEYDVTLFSLACNGSYRWSKVFGGDGNEFIPSVCVDSQDNVYTGIRFGGCGLPDNQAYPARIDNDWVLDSYNDCRLLALCKFDTQGQLLWRRQPDAVGVTFSSVFTYQGSKGMVIDENNVIHWLVQLVPGTYCNGALTATKSPSNHYVLKYDTQGNFLGAVDLDLQFFTGTGTDLLFYRNPGNGNYVVHFSIDQSNQFIKATLNGTVLPYTFYLLGFNAQGQVVYNQSNHRTLGQKFLISGVDFDPQNNIYLSGISAANNSADMFLTFGSTSSIYSPHFVMKLNPTADNIIWSSRSQNNITSIQYPCTIKYSNNQVIVATSAGYNPVTPTPSLISWDNQNIPNSTGSSNNDPFLAWFDANTGACTKLDRLASPVFNQDYARAITLDNNNDILLGGQFSTSLNLANNTSLQGSGLSQPFFVVKYASEACAPLANETFQTNNSPKLYPNPTQGLFYVETDQPLSYTICALSGSVLLTGQLNPQQPIDATQLPQGCYLVNLTDQNQQRTTLKLVVK